MRNTLGHSNLNEAEAAHSPTIDAIAVARCVFTTARNDCFHNKTAHFTFFFSPSIRGQQREQ